MWEKLIPKVKLRLNMYNSCLIQLLFTKKNNFFTKFSSNFELSIKFTQIKKVRFIDVIIPLRSVSTNVSNCIVLNFMYTKFQVSSSKKWQSYWYSNMVHLLLITLYLSYAIIIRLIVDPWLIWTNSWTVRPFPVSLRIEVICPNPGNSIGVRSDETIHNCIFLSILNLG